MIEDKKSLHSTSVDHKKGEQSQEINKKLPMSTSGLNEGSLLRLFKSSYFDAWMNISYLWRYSSPGGIHDYLVNHLYSLPDKQTEFYLTQLWYLIFHLLHMQISILTIYNILCVVYNNNNNHTTTPIYL
jgi:hypothetical protein